jgi:hypothetical protein
MEQQNGIGQPTSTMPIRGATIFLGAVVTFDIFIKILSQWKSYDWLGRSLSVVLLANLAVLLVEAFLGMKGKRKLQPDVLLLFCYMCLMLATSVFNHP